MKKRRTHVFIHLKHIGTISLILIVILLVLRVLLNVGISRSTPVENVEGAFCGGIAGKLCSKGFFCRLDGTHPDAGGKCTKTDFSKKIGNDDCVIAGCSNELCVEKNKEVASICIFKEEYSCLKYAVCEQQGDGSCGWTQTEKSTQCLKKLL